MPEGKGFDYQNPKKDVTTPLDPQGLLSGAPYPKALHKFVAIVDDKPVKDAVAVAYDGKTPIYNEYTVVLNADEEAAAIKDGWSASPVLKAAKK